MKNVGPDLEEKTVKKIVLWGFMEDSAERGVPVIHVIKSTDVKICQNKLRVQRGITGLQF